MKKYTKIFVTCLCLMAMLFTLTACHSEPTAPAQDTITFTDALGRDVTVPKNPKRVAALIGSFADVWVLAGGSVCAAPEDAWDDFELELPDAVNIGGAHSPNLELIFASEPDLVIASASTSSNVAMKETLEASGITVAYFDVDNFQDYLEMLDICTDITGRKDLYEEHGLALQSQIETIKAEVKTASMSDHQRTVLLLRAHSGSVKAKGSEGTILGEMLNDLGCINIADSDTSLLESLSVESIIRQNPYRIFVVTMGDDTEKALANLNQVMNENPAWQSLDAVTERRLYLMDRKYFNIKPNANWALSYETLSELLLAE